MKSICPTCKGPLYLPDENQSLRKWSVLCVRCHAIYLATPGTIIGAWLRYSYLQRVVYQARIRLQTGSTKTVELDSLISIGEPIILLTPLKGIGQLKPILLLEKRTRSSYFLIHPQQEIRKYQLYGIILAAMLVISLGIVLQGSLDMIIIAGIVSSLAVATVISRVTRGEEDTPQTRDRLILEQRLIKRSDEWEHRLDQLEKELARLLQLHHTLQPYEETKLFRIDSLSKQPRDRLYFEKRYHLIQELVGCYKVAKDLIDYNVLIIQLTQEVPVDLVDQLLGFTQDIEHLEYQYQIDD